MRHVRVVLAATIVVAASALTGCGVWRSGDAAPLYEQAASAYQAGRPETAVALARQALQRRLSFPTTEQLMLQKLPTPVLPTMRKVARGNAAYALALARNGKQREAMQICALTHAMSEQLLDDGPGIVIVTLAAIALDQIGERARTAALKAAGDLAGARASLAREQAMRAFVARQVKPSVQRVRAALDQLAREAAARGGPLDPQMAAEYAGTEREIATELAQGWRQGPGR